jgi:hypothetical protein
MAMGLVVLRVLRSSPLIIIPPMHHNNYHLHVAFNRRTKAKPGSLSKSNNPSEIGEYWVEKCIHFVFNPSHLPVATADRRTEQTTILRMTGRLAT